MGLAVGNARPQRQHRVRPVQRLNPTLLIDAKHHGFSGRIHVQSDHVAQFLDKVGVRRQFEAPDPMGLEPVLPPNLPNRAVAHVLRVRQAATTPMGARRRPRGQGRVDDGLHFRGTELLASARPRCITEHPGTPSVTNRFAHKRTVIRLTCSVRATAEGDSWCNSISTIRARRATFLGCRPLAGHLFQLGVLRRRGVDTVPLNEHAPPYQGGRAKLQHFVYSYFVLRTLVQAKRRALRRPAIVDSAGLSVSGITNPHR